MHARDFPYCCCVACVAEAHDQVFHAETHTNGDGTETVDNPDEPDVHDVPF